MTQRNARANGPRDVVVLLSSSRGGSSIVAEALRRQAGLLHFRAEVNPFFHRAGLAHPLSGTGSDALGAQDGDTARLEHLRVLLRADIGAPTQALPDDGAREQFAEDVHGRLVMQWPTLEIPPSLVRAALDEALRRAAVQLGWVGEVRDARQLWVYLLVALRGRGVPLDPYAYDLDRSVIEAEMPEARFGGFAPLDPVVEEPPFVTIGPWRRATDEDLARLPVVMKTPSNVWRLPFLARLWPEARLRYLHLTRNVAAAVNGLVDGWSYPGFHSHPTPRGWWKFDLPPGWEGWLDVPLPQRCAWQWRSAHLQILRELRCVPPEQQMRLRFEDLLDPAHAPGAGRELGRFLGVPMPDDLLGAAPPVMATEAPRRRRWFDRAELLGPIIADPENRFVMEELGYADDPEHWL